MVRHAHDGLEMWYATPDASAPDGTTERREGVTVTVGVRPASPSNAVRVRFRVDGRSVETVSALLVANDYQNRTQYFRAAFPTFWSGESVEYLPVVSCRGRRAPDPATASTFPTVFRLSESITAPRLSMPADIRQRTEFAVRLEHLVHVRAQLAREPEIFGETPAGFVINWYPLSGTLDGPAFHARLVRGGEHQTVVRADGIGNLSVSSTIETHDRALIAVRYSATVDFGKDWRVWLPARNWPPSLPVRSQPLMLTSDPRYRWLNRVHGLGIGEARLHEYLYTYDLYAVR